MLREVLLRTGSPSGVHSTVVYDAGTLVRQVRDGGRVLLHGQHYRVGQAFDGYPVALSPTDHDGVWQVWFAQHPIATLDETTKTTMIV